MGQESELQRLERFVTKLLTGFSELRAEKARLSEQLDERNREIEELRAKLATERTERGEIGQRVGRLVEQIEEWERSFDEAPAPAADAFDTEETAPEEQDVTVEYDVQADYETREEMEEPVAQPRGEEEGRVQHNLFSLTGTHR